MTYYRATINLPGHTFPLYGEATTANLLMLANNGTTPNTVTPELTTEAERIGKALAEGRTASTATATISPITEAEYNRLR